MTENRALILAAGRGSRLGELTKKIPKTLLPIGNSNCFDTQIKIYKELNFTQISVVTGFSSEFFVKYKDINIIHNDNWSNSNMLTSMLISYDFAPSTIDIISYGDIIFEPDAVTKMLDSRNDIGILYDTNFLEYWRKRNDNPLSDLEDFMISPEGKILKIGTKPTHLGAIQGQYMGVLRITSKGWKEIFEFIKTNQIQIQNNMSITEFLSHFILKGGSVYGVPFSGKWCEIDTSKDLSIASQIFYA